jgi:ATP-dependent Zn protease
VSWWRVRSLVFYARAPNQPPPLRAPRNPYKQTNNNKKVIELPLKHPELFESLGIAQPKGVLLYGPPGTGKTLLARAVAHHTDCTFIRVSGSELVQKYIGEGSRMVRELFVMARCVFVWQRLIRVGGW